MRPAPVRPPRRDGGPEEVDAVVVGAGINGMVAAALLAGAGWRTVLIDDHPEIGGLIAGGSPIAPRFTHDLFAAWHTQFVSGPAYAELGHDLREAGLRYAVGDDLVTGTLDRAGRLTVAYRDVERTVAEFARTEDRARYRTALTALDELGPVLAGLLGGYPRSVRHLWPALRLVRKIGLAGAETVLQDALSSGRSWCRRHFIGDEVDRLWVPWLLHAGLSPDHSSGGLVAPLLAGALHQVGTPTVVGGSGAFLDAFRTVLERRGVDIRTRTRVTAIETVGRRARLVRTASDTFVARRAVLVSGSPAGLYHGLLSDRDRPPAAADAAQKYRPGRAAMQIHVALTEPAPWRQEALGRMPLFHLSDGSGSTAVACAQAEAGLLPTTPTVVVGQQHVLDPSRVPDGAGLLWLQLQEVPFRPADDAAGLIDVRGQGWTQDVTEAYADRILHQLEAHAPGLGRLMIGRAVAGPQELAAASRSVIDGDPYAGSTELDQNAFWRPFPGADDHSTGVPGLWQIGAATPPGPGLAGISGFSVAQRLLRKARS